MRPKSLKRLSKRASFLVIQLGDMREHFTAKREESFTGLLVGPVLKGTMMVGGMSGYYEPEWSEETAWEALCDLVFWSLAEVRNNGEDISGPTMSPPREVLRLALGLVRERRA